CCGREHCEGAASGERTRKAHYSPDRCPSTRHCRNPERHTQVRGFPEGTSRATSRSRGSTRCHSGQEESLERWASTRERVASGSQRSDTQDPPKTGVD